jgi:hypothetical protein
MNAKTENHAEENAHGWADTIVEMYQGWKSLEDGEDTVTIDGEEFTDADEIREEAQESALEVQVRGDWHAPGDTEASEATEYYILLSTGGPALRIVGDLDRGQPDSRPRLQHQDWGTPWTEVYPDAEDWDEAVNWYLGCFYFGE